MSSPGPEDATTFQTQPDVPMTVPEEEEEGEGEDVKMGNLDDSSEEESEDEEEERRIRDGFIVDEGDEEGDDDDEDEEKERRRRRKRRKRHHRRRQEEELEEDDFELLEENTGASFKNRLTRLRRGRQSESPPATASKRRAVVESSDEDLDLGDARPRSSGVQNLWDDDRRGDDDEDSDVDSFIDYSGDDDGGREERRRAQREDAQRRRRAQGARPAELPGIDVNAWDELHDVFGDGQDYEWALYSDEDVEQGEELLKPDMKYQDVFEPSEINRRHLTEDDDLIRALDIPERMQMATSSLSQSSSLALYGPLAEDDLGGAAMWVTTRLPNRKAHQFFSAEGEYQHLKSHLVMAVTFVLRCLFVEHCEVPYIWVHKRDYISHFDTVDKSRIELLDLPELWLILALGHKYRSLLERRKTLSALYDRLQVQDEYFESEIMLQVEGVEGVADATEWLTLKYKDKKQDTSSEFRFHDDEEQAPEAKKHKMPSRISAYEVAKKSVISKLAKGFGIEAHQVVQNMFGPGSVNTNYVQDPELNPVAFAEQFADPDPAKAQAPEQLLARARMILATELGKDPLLRREIRKLFQEEALISIEPTERGVTKIDDHHPYFNFKYLYRKKVKDMMDSSQFLLILAAEAELLVNVSMFLPPHTLATFEKRISDAICSDSFSESAKAWNAERNRVVQEVLEQHLIPVGIKWTREWLREEVEDCLALKCGTQLRKRIDVAPYLRRPLGEGEYASSVLAISWGKGDPHKDAVTMVFLDSSGRLRAQTKIDNLHDAEMLDEFNDIISQKKPDLIVVGGFSMATMKLTHRIKEILATAAEQNISRRAEFQIPVQYVLDDVARIYQHSQRATDEFTSLSPIAKYCVGLARYMQSPLNEFAALGSDITAISLEEEDQHLVPKEKLLLALERVLVDVTNAVGVNINRAVSDPYYQHLLPFICGLGPRKAQALVDKIASLGGHLVNREQFIKANVLTTKIFLNAAGFLRISQYRADSGIGKHRFDDDNTPDPLDDTRIHLEDYELARKMATDALELDEEDIHDEHPSHVVNMIMADTEKERKLMELNLDEFAISLYEANQDQKRHTLDLIRNELLRPFADQRTMFQLPMPWEILTMLSGETQRTLRVGVIVSAVVQRINRNFVSVRLDSGIEGVINAQYLADTPDDPYKLVKKGQTVTGVIIDIKFELDQDSVFVELSSRKKEVEDGDRDFRRVAHDEYWNHTLFDKDKDALDRKKRQQNDRSRRVIKHPNFHNFNTAQAEAYLEKQQRGDVVIRPSSRGITHLAVTWKVDEGLYQHIDVVDRNSDPSGQTVGGQLYVDANHVYSDLDELIVNHIAAMARKVEDLMAHEKFKNGTEEELHLFLKNFLAANPTKSMYGFALNRKRPGHFILCFLANKNSNVQTWPVRVTPEAYYLFDAAAVGVSELCDAFKVRHLHESQTRAQNGGKTPYGAGLGRTPARPLGAATPGHASVRHIMQTPNPYGPAAAPPQVPYGTSTYSGYQTPAHRPHNAPLPPGQPSGVPPRPPAMPIHQSSSGWGKGGNW
ncbi:transcription elongation factor SPT6 [Coprinopsis marcescibilis]|uniref:Transcription elongation factor Spt6 n=1 Tax=Coprinopsis marcescibilis TaxID=230819 RepID=A0A5C3LB23_COPMA|nr:transcription elongation factor SPT6 [Coprinopsis marcescibilis]